MKLIECLMRQSTCYKGTTKGTPVGILWHDTGSGNPEIRRYVQPDDNAANRAELLRLIGKNSNGNDWNHPNTDEKGVNAFIGKLADGSIGTIQCLPWNYRPWGCGGGSKGSCNGSSSVENSPFWIQFEICDDGYKSKAYFQSVYKEAIEFTAYLCDKFGLDPNGSVKYNGVTVPVILCHQDSYKLGLGSNHGDVLDWFRAMGSDYTMAKVRKDVATKLKEMREPEMTKDEIQKMIDASTKSIRVDLAETQKKLEKLTKKFDEYRPVVSKSLEAVKKNAVDKANKYTDQQIAKLNAGK